MIAKVIIDRSSFDIDRTFDYEIPSDMVVEKGDRVVVPFGTKTANGFCIDIVEKSNFETKPILQVGEFKCFSEEMLNLMHFMRERFFLKYVDILRLFIPTALRLGKVKDLERYFISLNEEYTYEEILSKISSRAKKQREIVEALSIEGKYLSELTFLYGAQAVQALVNQNLLVKSLKKIDRVPLKDLYKKAENVELKKQQKEALDTIFNTNKNTILLKGVTGSGKTMVYIEAIKKVLSEGKSAIMLVPEIALTPQMLSNFRGVFGDSVAMLHSGLSDGERYDEWKKLLLGEAKIVVGARSAIFAPLQNVGIIVIDEEHDTSYISESNPRYRAIEVAKYRAKLNNAKVILGSATPSVDSYKKAVDGEYDLVEMNERISDKGMPNIEIVNMQTELLNGNNSMFSRKLYQDLEETINKGEQAMLLINRLGFASFIRCRKCGYVPKCEHCDVTLTYHKEENRLICHYCGQKYKMIDKCPQCGSKELKNGKMGTEKVVEEVEKLFPKAKVLKLDSNTREKKMGTVDVLRDFADNKANVLVGTQMIAKGHDFPNVTLVGLVDADLGLYQQDFRSNERTFQLVTQMAGRAGRAEKAGKVILQTYSPSSYVYRFAIDYDYEHFYKKEINIRETTSFPPFVTIVRVLVISDIKKNSHDVAIDLYKKIKELKSKNSAIKTLAGMEAPIGKMNDNFRYQLVMRIEKNELMNVLHSLYEIIYSTKKEKTSVFVEEDPQSLM